MSYRMYKPLANDKSIPKSVYDKVSFVIKEAISIIKPESYEFISIGPIMIVTSDLEEPVNQVKVSCNKDKRRKESGDYDEEIKQAREKLIKDQDLTQKEIKRLDREIKKDREKMYEIEEQLELLEKKAKNLGEERLRYKVKHRFDRTYGKFYETISEELDILDIKDKKDVVKMLENMNSLIEATIKRLS